MAKVIKKHGKTVLIIGLSITLLAMYLLIPQAQAVGTISARKITISDSRPTETGVTYTFTGTHSGDTVKCLELSFCTTATGDCTGPTGFTAANGVVNDSGWVSWDVIGTDRWDTGSFIATRVRYTYATGQAGGAGYAFSTATITNPTNEETYYARAVSYSDANCATAVDSGVTAFAIVYGVTVSATVSETLDFAISAVANADCSTYFGVLDGPASTASTVAYGTLTSPNTFYHGCNDLTVSTNAGSAGYGVTVQETTSLLESGGKTIDDSTGDSNSMDETTTSTWATAANNPGFGYACGNVSGTDCLMTSTSWYKQFACKGTQGSEAATCDPGAGSETSQTVMLNGGAVNASQVRIEYKLTIDGIQEAGAYSNTIVYIATPTY